MTRYFIVGEDQPFSESVKGKMFWYLPVKIVWANVMKLATFNCVRDSKGDVYSGDDFWKMAGDFEWSESRQGQIRRSDVSRIGQEAAS